MWAMVGNFNMNETCNSKFHKGGRFKVSLHFLTPYVSMTMMIGFCINYNP